MYSPFAHVSFWYAALATEPSSRPARYPFGGDQHDGAARRAAERLREQPPDLRKSLLRMLYGKASLLPWSALHHTWLQGILAACRPQWRLWALASLPQPLQAALQNEQPEQERAALIEVRPPGWWAPWFSAHVKRQLGYPDLPPWEKLSGAGGLPGNLWERDESELTRLLAIHGTQGFVSSVRRLPRAEAQRWLWQLPAQCQQVANETVQERKWMDDPFWPVIFRELEAEFPEIESRLFRIALADWMRAGLQQGQEPHLRRLAYRLPRRWGEWMLRLLEARPSWLAMPIEPGLEAWRQRLWEPLTSPAASGSVS